MLLDSFVFFVYVSLQPALRHVFHTRNPCQGQLLKKQFVNFSLSLITDFSKLRVLYKLSTAVFA